jgi:hypothetical protein
LAVPEALRTLTVMLAELSVTASSSNVAELFRTGTPSELDLHLAYLGASEQDEARAPYQNIVALGSHTAILHYVAYTRERVTGATSFLIDAGANTDCEARLLVQFAVMGAVYSRAILGHTDPVVGLVSIGGEETKGTVELGDLKYLGEAKVPAKPTKKEKK